MWPLILMSLSMLAVAWLAWKLVQRQERGDDHLESLLRKDDERADRGLRRAAGLPDEPAPGDAKKADHDTP